MTSNSRQALEVFDALRSILSTHAESLELVIDELDNYYLDTHYFMPNRKKLFFGAVRVRKRYVSFHLMPVYVNSVLLESISEMLGNRMQGKSCFNFTSIDPVLFDELKNLTEFGFRYYVEQGYIPAV